MSNNKKPPKQDEPSTYEQLFPGRFLKAGLFEGKHVTLTIKRTYREEMEQEDKSLEMQAILSFKETDKELALNRTNGECLKEMFGQKPKAWTGKRVTLRPDRCMAFGEKVDCIRVEGSPDIPRKIVFDLKLPKKNPIKTTLKKTGGATEKPKTGGSELSEEEYVNQGPPEYEREPGEEG